MTKYAIALTALLAVGCTDKADDSGDTSTDGGMTDGGMTDGGGSDDTTVACAFSSTDFSIDIGNGDDAGYSLGFAETDAASPDPWTGEDCGYVGYTTGSGTTYMYCHDISATGGTLGIVVTFEDVIEGSTTLHSGGLVNSFYLYEEGTGSCWTWGSDASYFFDCVDATAAIACAGD